MNTTQAIRLGWSVFAIALICSTSAGCRTSGWKMPGSSFFSWNREPDATKLAGNSTLPQYPESPATKHEPNAIASVGAGSADGSKVAATNSTGSTYGYPAQTVAAPKQGLAAQANGYQTGPYQVGEAKNSGAGSYASSQPAGGPLPNPYGGSYAGVSSTTSMPNVTLPSSVTSALNGSATNTPGTGSVASYPTASDSAGLPSYPNVTGSSKTSPVSTASQSLPSMPSYPAAGSAGSTGNTNSMPAYPSYPASPETAGGSATAAGSSSAHSTNSSTFPGASGTGNASGNYAPGTTSRSTGYDFSGRSSGGAAQGDSRLPPNTASETLPLLR